ncbi:glycoside hydrolase family 19 protein [Pseudomonas sp. R1-1]|uniref:glycoside hydrolase family 19 protein n=1 Tax=Pseudomonas sp. R1-1 TaxID=1602529 RepID=UPI003DA93BF6
MSTGLLEQRAKYPYSGYEYGYGKGGSADEDGNGRKEIDCSHLLNLMLRDAGYDIPYRTTSQLATDTTHFEFIALNSVQPGDIALWTGMHHTGVIEDMDVNRVKGNFFGSQSSTGPKSAKYGEGSGYWPMPNKYLRPKAEYKSGAQPTPAPAPAATPAQTGSPLMSFQYPFRKADGKQFESADEIYKALEKETSGHYLLGSNKFWHGGIHISNASAPQCILNEPIRCMADGEVVAYRLNEDYLESTFGENEKKLKYSNSFCLVRHEYKSALNPEDGPNKGKQNKLNFYSLYMHLLPFKRYPLTEEETPKPQVTMKVSDFNAYDDFPESSSVQNVGKLVAGTKLEILDQKALGNVTYAQGKILSGSVKKSGHKVREAGREVWFAYLKDGEPYKNSKPARIWLADPIPERLKPKYWQGKVKGTALKRLDLYQDPVSAQNGQAAGAKIGSLQLNPQSTVEFDSKEVLNLNVSGTIRRMAKCTSSGSLAGDGSLPPSFWAIVENDFVAWDVIPNSFDSVESASTGIKAGDPIGYLGLTENLTGEDGGVASKYQVHVEIFTAEADVKDFLKNTAGLKIGKQYLYLPAGSDLKKKAPATDSTVLKTEHAVDLNKTPVIKVGTDDYYDVTVTDNAQAVNGLVKKVGAQIITQHDWEKLGFQIVEETNATADGFLDPKDMPAFFQDLFTKVDKDQSGDVDPAELAEALKNPDTRSQWSKLVAHHPTEWKDKADAPKWSRLDTELAHAPKTLKHEKERINNYVFWGDLKGKASIGTGPIWHFHPVEFVANAKAQSSMIITLAMLKAIFKSADDPSQLQLLADELNPRLSEYKLDTPLRLSHFFAQVRVEVGDSYALVESLKYRPQVLINNFAYFKNRPDEADLYGFKPNVQSANQVEIANRAYNGVTGNSDLGNGNIASGDGWKYRGRGLKQLTGRYNYNDFTNKYPGLWPGENLNFINNPALLEQPKYAARSAVYFWLKNELYNIADKGDSESYVNDITKVINLHTGSYAERRAQFKRIWENEKIFR